MKRENQEADESIRRFNSQLQAMIREGKEALGTKIEVTGADGLEGEMDDMLVMEEVTDERDGLGLGLHDRFQGW